MLLKGDDVDSNTYLLLQQYQLSKLSVPSRQGRCQVGVELACTHTICSTLPHLQLNEEFSSDITTRCEDLLAVELKKSGAL